MNNMDMLTRLCNINAVSANEETLAKSIKEELLGCVDEITTDCLGNVIAHKKGNKNKIMFTSRMDETGGVVSYIQEDGKVRFCSVGECDAPGLINMTAVFKNGKKGIIYADKGRAILDIKVSDLYIDMGKNSTEICISDVFSVCSSDSIDGDFIAAKSIGGRSGVYALICAMKELKNTHNDIYAVFTSRSHIGFKGTKTASEGVLPQFAFCIGDVEESGSVKCGSGIAINLKGANYICDKTLLEQVRNIADKNKIPYVHNIKKDDMSEGGMIKKTGSGVKVLELSIPVKDKKKPRQSVNKNDVASMTELIKLIAEAELI